MKKNMKELNLLSWKVVPEVAGVLRDSYNNP